MFFCLVLITLSIRNVWRTTFDLNPKINLNKQKKIDLKIFVLIITFVNPDYYVSRRIADIAPEHIQVVRENDYVREKKRSKLRSVSPYRRHRSSRADYYEDESVIDGKPRSKVAVVVRTQKKPAVASTIWSRINESERLKTVSEGMCTCTWVVSKFHKKFWTIIACLLGIQTRLHNLCINRGKIQYE